jgi:P-type conjugative transfer ATPase TrbB
MSELNPREETERRLVAGIRHQAGAAICDRLDDPAVIEVMLNEDGTVWEDRLGVGMSPFTTMTANAASSLIAMVASTLRATVTRGSPILECELPIRGARFEAFIPPVSQAPIFAIRLKAVSVFTLDDYVDKEIMSPRQRAVIQDAVVRRQNILIAGGTSSGKTTLANAILAEIARLAPDDRLAILEDTIELQCLAANHFGLRTSQHVDMIRLLKGTMRMRPDRIIVGEVRDGAALAMIKAMNTGHSGNLCTVHANSAEDALGRIEDLVAEAIQTPYRAAIAKVINLIIPIQRVGKTSRLVNQIIRVEGLHDDAYVVTPLE